MEQGPGLRRHRAVGQFLLRPSQDTDRPALPDRGAAMERVQHQGENALVAGAQIAAPKRSRQGRGRQGVQQVVAEAAEGPRLSLNLRVVSVGEKPLDTPAS